MAIINTTNEINWENIQSIIMNVLLNKKLQFSEVDILPVIKKELTLENIDTNIIECSYFNFILLDAFDILIEKGLLYEVDKIYFPFDYILFNDYDTRYTNLFYLMYNDFDNQPIYFNIATLEKSNNLRKRDFLLTGGYDELEEKYIVPNISVNSIIELYNSFISEGSSKESAINHVLNFYDIITLSQRDYNCRTVIINDKSVKKSLTKTLKKDNI